MEEAEQELQEIIEELKSCIYKNISHNNVE